MVFVIQVDILQLWTLKKYPRNNPSIILIFTRLKMVEVDT